MEESEKSSEKTRLSHQEKSKVFGEEVDNNPSFEFDKSQGLELNFEVLAQQKAQDIQDIERL